MSNIFPCSMCPGENRPTFSKEKWLHSHVVMIHKNGCTTICRFCGEDFMQPGVPSIVLGDPQNQKSVDIFRNADNIRRQHETEMHKDRLDFPCKYCDQAFDMGRLRAKHMRQKHADKFPDDVVCQECSKAFLAKRDLAKHVKRYHPETYEKHVKDFIEYPSFNPRIWHEQNRKNPIQVQQLQAPFTIDADDTTGEPVPKQSKRSPDHSTESAISSQPPMLDTEQIDDPHNNGNMKNKSCEICHVALEDSIFATCLHYLTSHSIRVYVCDLCPKPTAFLDRRSLLLHSSTHVTEILEESNARVGSDNVTEADPSSVAASNPIPDQCKTITEALHGPSTSSQNDLQSTVTVKDEYVEEAGELDIEISTSIKTEVLQSKSEEGEIDENIGKSNDRIFDCHLCTKSCQSQLELSLHFADAHRSDGLRRTSVCKYCERSFTSSEMLTKHMWQHHSEHDLFKDQEPWYPKKERRLKCQWCQWCDFKYHFNAESKLRIHVRKSHPEKLPFPCDACTIRFESENELRSHRSIVHARDVNDDFV